MSRSRDIANIISIGSTGTGSAVFNTAPSISSPVITAIEESVNIVASAATGTINLDALTSSIWYYTSNSSGNWTLNIRGNSGATLNSILSIGQSIAINFLATNGSSAFYQTALQIDGSSITPKWAGGTAPSAGNANSIDMYAISIIKTANATFTAIESQVKVS